jgi:hypothetical protein
MKIRLFFDKENVGRAVIALILGGVLYHNIHYRIWLLILFAAVYFAVKSLEIKTNEKLSGLFAAVMMAVGCTFTAHLVQYLLLDSELRSKITSSKMWLNVACCLVVYLIIQLFTNNVGLTSIIAHISLMSLAWIDYFVYLFRGNEFIFSDVRSIQTGLSVAGNYEYTLDERAVYVIFLTTLYIALVRKFHITFVHRITATVVVIAVGAITSAYISDKSASIVTETWEQKGSYRNGYILNFMLSIRDSIVAEPDGYSAEAVAALEEKYSGNSPENDEEKPTIIVVMSESYSDLSVVGNFLTNVPELTPFYDSLSENTMKGYALSSVFGAKTSNSEWEFMTGNSMAFLPSGSVVYQQYISSEPTSIVSNLKNIGYTCVAMHPYYATGWSRNLVYPDLGFDEMYFIDDFDESAVLREYITDRELYEKIINRFEKRGKNEDLFIMSISMQNHGGYTNKYDNFDEQVRVLGMDYPDANQYLSLIHESDAALEYLITYFSEVDEPVEIVFFGDHQPSLSSSFYVNLNGKGLSGLTEDELENLYTVPFFIWTNYDTEEETVDITSLNFLSTYALKRAGISLPAYNQFLSDMMEAVPAINSRGYYSKENGDYMHLEDASGDEALWIENYNILQYNGMFDNRRKSSVFFPYME